MVLYFDIHSALEVGTAASPTGNTSRRSMHHTTVRRAINKMSTRKYPIHSLPLAPTTLQGSLPRLMLDDKPSAQRRATSFKNSSDGVWSRVYPLWTTWPLRITKEEIEEMGVDVEKGEQVSVEDVLARWDPKEVVGETGENGLELKTSAHRAKIDAVLLGVSQKAIEDSLPHLDVGDAVAVSSGEGGKSDAGEAARQSLVSLLSGKHVLVSKESNEEGPVYGPWSTRYCGHQFGSWAGQLGDGRATSLIETVSPDGTRTEIQLKGAGRTPFSRQADGLAVLRSGVREYLGSEAIAALGIPTTRALAILGLDGLPVIRENGPEYPSVLARLAPSFVRIGHYEAMNPSEAARNFSQIFLGGWQKEDQDEQGPLKGQGSLEGLRDLVEWGKSVLRYEGGTEGFLKEVAKRNAEMVGAWQVYGFMHGVLNSDNISILGLTIDYGPYAFMDIFDENHICNHSDPSGLYAYKRQPERVLFALDKLASALSPLIGYEALHGPATKGFSEDKTAEDVKKWDEKAVEVIQGWEEEYWRVERATEQNGWLKRFGLRTEQKSDARDIIMDFLILLRSHDADFNASFRKLSSFDPLKTKNPAENGEAYTKLFAQELINETIIQSATFMADSAQRDFEKWLDVYALRLLDEAEVKAWEEISEGGGGWVESRKKALDSVNPRFVLRQWVLEEVIGQLENAGFGENINDGRKNLARVLEMATNPFEPYEDDASEEGKARARLCGLGGKEMLGFQCSCSS